MSEELKASFAWTPSKAEADYEHYPPYVNLTDNRLAIRGPEKRGEGHVQQGDYVAIELTGEALDQLASALASRTPTEATEPGEAEIERVARAIAPRIRYAFDVETMNRASRWETASELLCLIAEDAIAALRSTTPSSERAERISANYREMHGLPETEPLTENVAVERMAAFGASDAACRLYPGRGQGLERAAFRAGAAHAVSAPATDVVEAENYASEFVKGEAPADVSKAVAVDDDALVERAELRKIIAELGYCTADASLEFMRLIPGEVAANLQSLQASIRVKDEALRDLLDGSERIARYHGIDIDAECAAYQDSPFAKARAALSQPIGGE